MPALRQMSATGNPSAPCFRMNAFWASVNFEAFIDSAPPNRGNPVPKTLTPSAPIRWAQTKGYVTPRTPPIHLTPSLRCIATRVKAVDLRDYPNDIKG